MKAAAVACIALALAACAAPPLPAIAPVPSPVQCGAQQYPFNALQDFARGQVQVRAEVGPMGVLSHPVVEQPTVNAYLNAGAIDALRHCRMPGQAPGTIVHLVVVYDFLGGDEYLPRGTVTVLPAAAAVK